MTFNSLFHVLGLLVIASPIGLAIALCVPALFGRPLRERQTNRCTYAATTVGLVATLILIGLMLIAGSRHVELDLGNLATIEQQHFHFTLKFVFDRLSLPFVGLSFMLCGVVAAFTSRYLHREPGFARFYICYSLFLLGMVVSSTAGTIELLFLGWELVGLSSALLVGFFHERVAPVQNGMRVWSIYRMSDAAFLMAAVALHHITGSGDFDSLAGSGSWPDAQITVTSNQALLIGSLLLVAAAGKSALVPFSGWLPRAMEGPTPSSAIFYGALSVHLGAFLLLRVSPLLAASTALATLVFVLGMITAAYAALAARVQTDIKSALAFASLTQVGLIVAEIGIGLRYVALVHIIGHACLRTLQLLRAPTLLHDYHILENAIGGHDRIHRPGPLWLPQRLRIASYRFALERGHLDTLIDELVVRRFTSFFRRCDAAERRWRNWLSGRRPTETGNAPSQCDIIDEPAVTHVLREC